ncbi:MAG: phytanoyl-CoA dioxygenase family protein [Chthonomonadales bacterium]|nr:phytanoyl-CoA dioxygenase family protein [Chthonomonadales bacterium]
MTLNTGAPIEVPRVLDDADVRQYVEHGYVVVEGLIGPDEVEELRRDTVDIARGIYPCESLQTLPAETTDEEALRSILCIHQPHYVSPVIARYLGHPRIAGVLSQVVGAHLPFWDGSVKCMQSMLFVKPPGFQGQAWHQDEIYIPTRDRSLAGGWIALDDATRQNGCLYVVPGSHRSGYLYPQRQHGQPDEFDFAPESHGFDESAEVPVEVPAGTVVFFNGHLLHRSRRNRGTGYRRVLVNHYCNAWSPLPWQVREGETPATADRRCVVPVAGVDPYAWKGYESPTRNVWLRTCKARNEELARMEG